MCFLNCRMAGGAVRDLLMNIKPSDIDFATVFKFSINKIIYCTSFRQLHLLR
jgi:tRNA nucleotidyltransferase/poly(A) polymerase